MINKKLKMVNKKEWKEFRESGMLWWINMILHTFGWAIVVEINDNNDITNCYPARVRFRGFKEKDNTIGYRNVSKYLNDEHNNILDESLEGSDD